MALLTPDGGVPLQHAAWALGGHLEAFARSGARPLTLTLAARLAGLDGASDRTVNITESTFPTVASVVTGGTFSAYRAVAPGSFVTLLGSGFTDLTGAVPMVTLGGQAVQTVFVSANQINALLPAALPTPQIASLVVRRGAQISVPEPVSLAAVAPDVFVIPQAGGRMQGAVTDPQFRLVDLSNPQRRAM